MITKGLCECGCGQKTNLARQDDKKRGYIKGEPVRFVRGHQGNLGKYRGGKAFHSCGYDQTLVKDHPRADQRGYVSDHVLTCEKALGKFLPDGAIPHHVNEDKKDNGPGNLVICQDRAYHNLLHQRIRSLKACGHASWRKCPYCQKYDDPKNMLGSKSRVFYVTMYHSDCRNQYRREQNANRHRHSKVG